MSRRKIKLDEGSLILAIQEKKELGAQVLYDMYSSSLHKAILRIVQETVLAEDILQETFIRIWTNFEKYDPVKGRLYTWIVNVARRMAIDSLRTKSYRQQGLIVDIEEHSSEFAVQDVIDRSMDYRYALSLLHKLVPREQNVLELIYLKGYKHTEVAEALGMPLGSVKTCCRSGVNKLRSIYIKDIQQLASAS
ncbi:sigma-70 family RNA polymerase sigma factor [Mucilaginibacter sp. 21P]|uniref:RNA polymerase sigma factor n=1 Tax=Mucilaginibacter sp. 21P TaxID=2778902 RepID=UPI001C55F5E0|nr:sigma-70 family RNA polymerase sigma factor [Mucilaginibacter sp. 21P]QXV64022.1 sigma-70 family RNA polymerase sigma factor [Mucilaginibacter sp. 21P]